MQSAEIKKSLFVDIDGPILDVSERYYNVYYDFCRQNNIRPVSKKYYWQKRRRKQNVSLKSSLTEKYKEFWIKTIELPQYTHFDTIRPHTIEVLAKLQQNCNLYAVSLRQNAETEKKTLKQFGVSEFFNNIYIAPPSLFETMKNWRIKRALIHEIASLGDIIIGDTPTDIKCGQSLRFITVAVLSGITNYSLLKSYQPDYIIRKIDSLPRLLDRNNLL